MPLGTNTLRMEIRYGGQCHRVTPEVSDRANRVLGQNQFKDGATIKFIVIESILYHSFNLPIIFQSFQLCIIFH